ncbi:MAG TPA: MFS transporter [Bryobacteraceae bacterium]|nr:MFS transporter [Bryobacteraceae bacterium]
MTQSDREAPASQSPWRPLGNQTFRYLLAADLISDIGAFMQSVGAAWLMTSLTNSPLYIALIQTASALPFFLLALPAGSVGDIFDRRKLILGTEIWMLGIAAVLAVTTFAGAMTPWLLLLLTLGLSIGDAVESPAWRAIFPELVNKDDLPGALALSGIEFNLARAVGPGLAGVIIAVLGVATAFAFNALSFLGVIVVVAKWNRPVRKSKLPAETFRGATAAAIRYVRYSPGIRTLLLRSACLIFFTSSFWALLPTAAREISKSPLAYGFLLGFFGVGAIIGAVVLQRTRSRLSTETILSLATATFAAIILSLALLRTPVVLCVLMLFGGASWTVFMSLFNIMVQDLAPDWVRARVLAVYLFVFQGSVAVGSTLWGFVASHTNVHITLVFASIGTGACLFLGAWFKLPNTAVDLSVWNHWVKPAMLEEPAPDQGPVLVTVKYVIDPAKAPAFLHEIYKYQRVRRRDGATRWGVFSDTESPDVYLENFLVDSWAEHERQHYRFTVADRELEKRVLSYALKPVEVKHYISAREGLRF